MEKIRIFTVGGTIDKIYFDAKSRYEVGPPNIGEILSGLSLNPEFDVTSLMQKDSLDMSDADRQQILEAVTTVREQRIIITHGTDTMVQTAAVLSSLSDKVIVLTGALAPARFAMSDATLNVGMALAAVQTQMPGVYIVMNGTVFPAKTVIKNRKLNRFESKSG